jgi:hypothetical protein
VETCYIPWENLLYEKFDSKLEVIKREKFLKSEQGRDYLKTKLK